jgi:hypothetical protein
MLTGRPLQCLQPGLHTRLTSAWQDESRGNLEAVAPGGYREGTFSGEQVWRVVGFSFWETEAFLEERQGYLAFDEQDLRPIGTLRGVAARLPPPQDRIQTGISSRARE